MAINIINVGISDNDGTGDPIRDAFEVVNDNFQQINSTLFAGGKQTIISAVSIESNFLISNTYIYANTYANANTLVGRKNIISQGNIYSDGYIQSQGNLISQSNLTVQSNGALINGQTTIVGNVNIVGNLSVSGSQTAAVAQTQAEAILNLQYSATPLISDNSKDIGLSWQYYKGGQLQGFLGWQNSTRTLVYLDDITESVGNIISAGTPGNVKFGQLLLSNTTSTTSNVTGALIVSGGAGIQGNVYVQSNLFVGNTANVATLNVRSNLSVQGNVVGALYLDGGINTIYIGGSPVQTAAQAFTGGAVPTATQFNAPTAATSTTSGAVTIAGGLGVAGNVFVSNLEIPTGGNLRSNIIGTVFTGTQPYITSVGALTGLTINGTTTSYDINPNSTLFYSLGAGTSNRWNKLWIFDIDMSGTFTGGAVDASSVRVTGNTQATSTTTGALRVTGGASINTGNLYIGGSGGDSIVTSSNVKVSNGHVNILNGNIYTTGVYVTNVGDSIVASGNIRINSGNVNILNGNVNTTGLNVGNLYINGSSNSINSTANLEILSQNVNVTGNIYVSANVVGTGGQFSTLGVGTPAAGAVGDIRATNNITAFYSSDIKFKQNIRPIPDALNKVLAIGGKLFNWTDEYINSRGGEDGYFVRRSDFGVIAQDVQQVFPEAARTKQDGTLAIDYEKLSALAFAAIAELYEIIKDK